MGGAPESMPLGDGAEIRCATPGDVEAIVGLQVGAFGLSDEPGVRAHLTGPGARIDDWAVVRVHGRVAAASALLDHSMTLDGLPLSAGQIEWVATDPSYRRRGLVRAQFEWHHRRSAVRCHDALLIGGIPYFYRRFGYGYGLDHPRIFLIDRNDLQPDPTVSLRPATEGDIPRLLQIEAGRPRTGLRVERPPDVWRRWLAAAGSGEYDEVVVAEREGRVAGWATYQAVIGDRELFGRAGMAEGSGVTDALLGHGLERASSLESVFVAFDVNGTAHGARVCSIGKEVPYGLGVYARIADPIQFLDLMRPLFSERLAASPFGRDSGELSMSFYNSSAVLTYEHGTVENVRVGPPIEDPFDELGVGVAPDWLPALVFGRFGAKGLADRCDDVTLGKHAELMEVLFPRRPSEVVADF